MREDAVCAIVITYHPTAAMIENLPEILKQTDRLVVVDNGSTEDELAPLRQASQQQGALLIENGSNLGIAEALNRGVAAAKAENWPFILLFDQDSELTRDFVKGMLACLRMHPQRDRIGSLHPRYVNRETGSESRIFRAADGGPMTSMTSGALMPAWIFDKIGLFAADYFIDLVDCEYCLRIRANGYIVADSREAVLWHKAGSPDLRKVLGFRFGPTHHSAIRRYYMSRNRIAVYRSYFFKFPRWTIHSAYISARETIKCFLAERQRPRKFRNFLLGSWDGLVGRMGRRDDL